MSYPLRALLMTTVLTAAACAKSPTSGGEPSPSERRTGTTDVPSAPADIRGTITHVRVAGSTGAAAPNRSDPNGAVSCPPECGTGGGRSNAVLIEEVPGGLQTGGRKVVLTVTTETKLFRGRGAGPDLEPMSFADLRVGQIAEAWAAGAMAQSYPAQGTAATLIVRQ